MLAASNWAVLAQSPTAWLLCLRYWAAKDETKYTVYVPATFRNFRRAEPIRAGIEGTLSQDVRAFELRRTRYIGLAKIRLQHIVIAVVINLTRLFNMPEGVPMQLTRTSHFAQLAGI